MKRKSILIFIAIILILIAKWVYDVNNEMVEHHRRNPSFHYIP